MLSVFNDMIDVKYSIYSLWNSSVLENVLSFFFLFIDLFENKEVRRNLEIFLLDKRN